MDARVGNLEKMVKKLADQNCTILKTVADNFNTLLNKFEQGKGQDSKVMKEDQGPSKRTRDDSKKNEGVEENNLDDMKAYVENMNILVDQAVDLLKTL